MHVFHAASPYCANLLLDNFEYIACPPSNPYPELKSQSGTPGPGEYNAHTPRSLSPKKVCP